MKEDARRALKELVGLLWVSACGDTESIADEEAVQEAQEFDNPGLGDPVTVEGITGDPFECCDGMFWLLSELNFFYGHSPSENTHRQHTLEQDIPPPRGS